MGNETTETLPAVILQTKKMFTHQHQKRVRYGETDQMGYLYYGNYAQYYEIGRVEMLRSMGLTYKEFEETYQIMMPVMNMESRFVRPAHYDDNVTIITQIRELPQMTILFHFEIKNEAGKLINGGRVRLCFIDMKTNRPIAAPEFLLEKLRPHFETN